MDSRKAPGEEQNGSVDFAAALSAARDGSDTQQAELLDTFRGYLHQYATQIVSAYSGQSQLSASDLVQDAIVDATDGFDRCRAVENEEFKAWLREILMKSVLSKHQLLAPELDSPVTGNHQEEEQFLIAAIEKLAPDHQQVIRLRHQDKLTFLEIGEQMNRPPDEVRMLWHRAVEGLSKVL